MCGGLFLLADLVSRGRGELADRLEAGPSPVGRGVLGARRIAGATAVVGLPPSAGFVGTVVLPQAVPGPLYALLLLGGGLIALIGLSRAGSTLFWRATGDGEERRLDGPRLAATVALLATAPALAVWGQPGPGRWLGVGGPGGAPGPSSARGGGVGGVGGGAGGNAGRGEGSAWRGRCNADAGDPVAAAEPVPGGA